MDIEEMGKFGENFEYNEIATTLDFGFGSSNIASTSHLIFPSFNNIPPTTLSMNDATHPVAPRSFPPYSAAARWRSHFPATRNSGTTGEEEVEGSESESMGGGMREMIYRIAAMQPIEIDPEAVKAPKRRNVKISKDPQSVAARHRRERISERIRILQRIVPGGTKMDTASMLDEAIHYLKFLKNQLHSLQIAAASSSSSSSAYVFPTVAHYNNKQHLIHFPQFPTHPHHHLDQDA